MGMSMKNAKKAVRQLALKKWKWLSDSVIVDWDEIVDCPVCHNPNGLLHPRTPISWVAYNHVYGESVVELWRCVMCQSMFGTQHTLDLSDNIPKSEQLSLFW